MQKCKDPKDGATKWWYENIIKRVDSGHRHSREFMLLLPYSADKIVYEKKWPIAIV
jgi:hypothetical protein